MHFSRIPLYKITWALFTSHSSIRSISIAFLSQTSDLATLDTLHSTFGSCDNPQIGHVDIQFVYSRILVYHTYVVEYANMAIYKK